MLGKSTRSRSATVLNTSGSLSLSAMPEAKLLSGPQFNKCTRKLSKDLPTFQLFYGGEEICHTFVRFILDQRVDVHTLP